MIADDVEWVNLIANRIYKRLPPQVDRGELISDGYLALIELRKQFDASRGVPFRGFAFRRVRGAMIDGLRRRRLHDQRVGKNDRCVDVPLNLRPEFRLEKLPRKSRLVIQLHYLEQVELQTVARIFACTKARVSQIHQRALGKLREELTETKNGATGVAPPRDDQKRLAITDKIR